MNSTSAHSMFQPGRVPRVSLLRPGKAPTLLRKLVFAILLTGGLVASSQTADQAWLSYPGVGGRTSFPRDIRALGSAVLEQSAVQELKRCRGPLATGALTARAEADVAGQTIIGTVSEFRQVLPSLRVPSDLQPGGYWVDRSDSSGSHRTLVVGADELGVLYGAFALLRPIAW